MFDHIGRENDPNASKRRAHSAVFTASLAGITGAVAIAFTLLAPPMSILEPIDETMVQLVQLADPVQEVAPAAPAAPQISKGTASETVEANPDTPNELPDEIPTTTIADSSPVGDLQGTDDGTPGGDIKGIKNGIPGGKPQGTGTAVGPSGPVRVHHQELEIARQIQPQYPRGLRGMGNERCLAEVTIDAKGKPVLVTVTQCPNAFHAETTAALMKWRFRPYRIGGQAVPARTSVGIRYTIR